MEGCTEGLLMKILCWQKCGHRQELTYSQADIELDFYNASITDADKITVELS